MNKTSLDNGCETYAGSAYCRYWPVILVGFLVLVSLYDLMSPRFIGPTILRQTQTAMLTENFVREGFSLKGLYLNIHGNEKPIMAFEFPIYNAVVGLAFSCFSFNPIWGKIVSFVASVASLFLLCFLVRNLYGERMALYSGLLFILSPLGMMMRTAFQPDSLGLMFVLASLAMLYRWRKDHARITLVLFSICLVLAGLTKYPLLVPYLPVIALAFISGNEQSIRFPDVSELFIVGIFFVAPILAWYSFRGQITHPAFGNPLQERSMFLFGDLMRFFSFRFYTIPTYCVIFLACSGIGVLLLLLSLLHLSPLKAALLLGIPLYLIVIPTSAVQHYYWYACTPLFAFLMADGYCFALDYCGGGLRALLKYGISTTLIIVFMAVSIYAMVVRQDKVIYEASDTVRRLTASTDLIFVMNMHNLTNGFGGNNPTLFYLAKRNGWNISASFNRQEALNQIEARRQAGARWLVITWYTPDLESRLDGVIPAGARTKSDPGIDGEGYFNELRKKFPVAYQSKNYALLKL